MTTSTTLPRPLTEADLSSADRIFRLAFGTFLGLPNPESFAGDANYIATRWRADPSMAIGVDRDGELVGSNFVTLWGSVGFFGPLTVRPDLWDQGIAKQLLEPTVALLDGHGVQLAGLFTFAQSAKHVGLYQQFGFWPQHLTGVFARPVAKSGLPGWSKLTEASDPDGVVTACAEVTSAIYDGLDMQREILAVAEQGLGEVVLLDDGDRLDAFAVCHIGLGSEAGSGTCYVKAGAVRPGPVARDTFGRLLDACEDLAVQRGASVLVAGVNTGRHEAYVHMLQRGFRTEMQGVVMTRPNSPGYNRPGVYVIDDWR
jgi:GNAT superfamily N-acetyltransferase